MKPFFQKNKSLKDLSTFGIGGPAQYFAEVESVAKLQEVLRYCHSVGLPFHVVGKGSNSLFSDEGFDGLVILNKIQTFEIHETEVIAGGGYSFSLLGVKTARLGLGGLEFASGIPASVGGAVFMNAGANGTETADSLSEVTFVDHLGAIQTFSRPQLEFGYRTSCFHKRKGVIALAKFNLTPFPEARQNQLDIIAYRQKTQPLKEKSCGCVFRNPPGEKAGALIEHCGLKGVKIGGAEVSSLHANFIVNSNQSKAADVLALATHVQKYVKEKTGIELEMELRRIDESV